MEEIIGLIAVIALMVGSVKIGYEIGVTTGYQKGMSDRSELGRQARKKRL